MDEDWDEDEEYDYDWDNDDSKVIDEEELLAFMNEFFMINGNIPDAEFF